MSNKKKSEICPICKKILVNGNINEHDGVKICGHHPIPSPTSYSETTRKKSKS